MLEDAFKDLNDGVYVQTRQDVDLYKVAQFKAKTQCSLKLIIYLPFVDDSALLAHSPKEVQQMIIAFSEASKKVGLKINI